MAKRLDRIRERTVQIGTLTTEQLSAPIEACVASYRRVQFDGRRILTTARDGRRESGMFRTGEFCRARNTTNVSLARFSPDGGEQPLRKGTRREAWMRRKRRVEVHDHSASITALDSSLDVSGLPLDRDERCVSGPRSPEPSWLDLRAPRCSRGSTSARASRLVTASSMHRDRLEDNAASPHP